MHCKHCGNQIENDSKFCSFCGGKIEFIEPQQAVTQPTQKPESLLFSMKQFEYQIQRMTMDF